MVENQLHTAMMHVMISIDKRLSVMRDNCQHACMHAPLLMHAVHGKCECRTYILYLSYA